MFRLSGTLLRSQAITRKSGRSGQANVAELSTTISSLCGQLCLSKFHSSHSRNAGRSWVTQRQLTKACIDVDRRGCARWMNSDELTPRRSNQRGGARVNASDLPGETGGEGRVKFRTPREQDFRVD